MDMERGESQRSIPTPFLAKTYQLVDEEGSNDVISWNEDGSSFVVWNITVLARDLLPNYFKHNNFSSFVRQLNTYGFKKLIPDRWEFSHDCFRRGHKHLLRDIHRRKINPLPTTTTSARHRHRHRHRTSLCGSNCSSELSDENQRLRKQNLILAEELTHMKSLCRNIFSLVSGYANMTAGDYQSMLPESKPSSEESESPRLFGVPIRVGAKRSREEPLVKPEAEAEAEPSEDCHAEQWFFRQTHGPDSEVNLRTVYN